MYKLTFLTAILFGTLYAGAQELTIKNQYSIPFNNDYIIPMDGYDCGIAIDSEGNKIMVGSFSGENVAFDATHVLNTKIEANAFMAKYNSNNEIIWIKSIGGSQHEETHSSIDQVSDVLVDNENNVYVLADIDLFVSDTIDLDPEHSATLSTMESEEYDPWEHGWLHNSTIVLAKYSPEGSLTWYREFRITKNTGYRLCFDQNNNLLVTGSLGGLITFDFDPIQTHPNDEDIITANDCYTSFIASYSHNGEFIAVRGIGGGTVREVNIHSASSGNFYITGDYHSASGLELFINDTTPHKTPKSMFLVDCDGYEEDVFIAKCNSQGHVQWAKTIHSMQYNRATEIRSDENENVYVTGCFRGSNIDFDLDNSLAYDTKSSVSGGTAFVAKYEGVTGDLIWLRTIEGGNSSDALSMLIQENNIVVAGQFQGNVSVGNHTLNSNEINPFIAILDTAGNWITAKKVDQTASSAISKLTIASDGTIHFLGYVIGGIFPNVRTFDVDAVFMGELLCDQFIDTVTEKITRVENVCDSYISPSGMEYTTSGVYSDTIFNTVKDTVYIINLTVSKPDPGINSNGNVLTASEQDASYQWINCETNTLIDGAISQTFTASENGDYAVIINNSTCIDTSGCISVAITELVDIANPDEIEIFPNPISDVFSIKSLVEIRQINIYNITGNLVLRNSNVKRIDINELPKGMYIVEIITDSGFMSIKKVIKK